MPGRLNSPPSAGQLSREGVGAGVGVARGDGVGVAVAAAVGVGAGLGAGVGVASIAGVGCTTGGAIAGSGAPPLPPPQAARSATATSAPMPARRRVFTDQFPQSRAENGKTSQRTRRGDSSGGGAGLSVCQALFPTFFELRIRPPRIRSALLAFVA
jgi:hypothetical protein